MVTCCVLGCKSRSGKSQNGITFHKFPNNPELKAAWIAAVKRRNWQPTAHSTVCSIHFREEDVDRTSLCCVRIRENRVPCLVSTTGSQKHGLSAPSEGTDDSRETPLDKLAKVATAALEAAPTDCSENREMGSSTTPKPKDSVGIPSASDALGRLRVGLTKFGNFIPVFEAGKVGVQDVAAEVCAGEEMPEKENETLEADQCEADDTCSNGSQPSESCSRMDIDCVNMDVVSEDSGIQLSSDNATHCNLHAVVVSAPDAVCVISDVRGAADEDSTKDEEHLKGVETVACTAVPQAHLIDHGTMCRKRQVSEQTPRTTKASVPQKHPSQNGLNMVYTSPESSDNLVNIVYCETVAPTVQTVIADHAGYCGKPAPVLKTASAVSDHANYSRKATAVAQADLPAVLPDENEVPAQPGVSLSTSQASVLYENAAALPNPASSGASSVTPGPKPQAVTSRCSGDSCVHEGIANMLKDELRRMAACSMQRRKRVKVLQQALRRSRQKNEKLEKLVTELRKRPKPEDKEEIHKKMGKVSVDFWTRQELKAKGEAVPIEYSSELGTFAKTLHSYSPDAYDYVRRTFQGCLPHSRTLMKWRSLARTLELTENTGESAAVVAGGDGERLVATTGSGLIVNNEKGEQVAALSEPTVLIENERGEQLVVPMVVISQVTSDVVQMGNIPADASST